MAPKSRLVFASKAIVSCITGSLALLFGLGCFYAATLRPGEPNGWVPWVVGAMFTGLGLFTLLSRTRVVFDITTRRWLDSWGILWFEFSQRGSFDQLEKIRIEESSGSRGSVTHYVWVLGRPKVRIIVEVARDSAAASRIADELSSALDLPVERIKT